MRSVFLIGLLVLASAQARDVTNVDLLLVAADDATLQPVLSQLHDLAHETHGAWTVWTGTLASKKIAATRTEGDPLNAVAATTLAIRAHPPRLIFVFGTARSHDSTLHSGDIVVSQSFAAFDGMYSPPTELGAGTDATRWLRLPHPLMSPGEKEIATPSFAADSAAAAVALTLKVPERRVLAGVIGSAAQTNREADRIAYLHEQWHTSSEDSESAFVAGCAALFGVPVVGARVIDGTPGSAAEFALQFVSAWK